MAKGKLLVWVCGSTLFNQCVFPESVSDKEVDKHVTKYIQSQYGKVKVKRQHTKETSVRTELFYHADVYGDFYFYLEPIEVM